MKLVLIDISNFIYRAYYGMPKMLHMGQEVGALYGVCSELIKIIKLFPNSNFIAAFDCSKKTFRTAIDTAYKSNRKEMPQELVSQCNLIPDCCLNFGIDIKKMINYEADDIIASFTKYYYQTNNIVIVSPDKDLLQLLSFPNVQVYNPVLKKFITETDVRQKFGVSSFQLLDLFALIGDKADNISGIVGIGPKSAAALLQKYQSLENIIANLELLPNSRINSLLKNNINCAITAKQLITLQMDLDLEYNIIKSDFTNLEKYLYQFGFYSLINRWRKI